MKRDDLTGIGMGGNKLRKLDYIVKKALDEGCTTLLTYGGVQTNHGRLTAAAAARFGMKSIIMVLYLLNLVECNHKYLLVFLYLVQYHQK